MAQPAGGDSKSRTPEEQKAFEESSDFANYFCSYAYLYHQKEMLEDQVRMDGYYQGIMKNKHHFEGKVVLDVGAGSGILSIWSAMAGAKKVYGVEATQMSKHARKLVEGCGLSDKVEIICAKMEELELPEKVDVIISEWMGYWLLRESMLDSVLDAKKKWGNPNVVMYPSHAKMFMAPVYSDLVYGKKKQMDDSIADWQQFTRQTKTQYGVDMGILTDSFAKEQEEYSLKSIVWNEVSPNSLVGEPVMFKEIDLNTATVEDYAEVKSEFASTIRADSKITAFAGWFSTDFAGNPALPAKEVVTLDTRPGVGYTHWGQQLMFVYPPVTVKAGDKVEGTVDITRSKANMRLMDVGLKFKCVDSTNKPKDDFEGNFQLQ